MSEKFITRRSFIKTIGAGSMLAFLPYSHSFGKTPSRKPNIVFILADDLGYGDVGCYGQERIKTPRLDQMAEEGIRFTQFYAGSTVCAPSRCSLMTGLHTGHCRIRGNNDVLLEPEDVTVAELLKPAGYTNACIGKWGIGNPPPPDDPGRNGFDYFYGYLSMWHAHNYYTDFLWRNGEKVPLRNVVKHPEEYYKPSEKDLVGVATTRVDYSHDLFTEEALEFIEKRPEEPFFLFLSYTIPHANNEALDKGMEVPDYGIYENEDWPDSQKGHAAMISRMDGDVGKILEKIGELGLDEDTLVIFTSDNGPHKEAGVDPEFNNSSGPLRGIKRDLYEGGIRVPMIARWPGKIEPGTVTDHVSAFWDFLPTACEIAGINSPENVDGISFLPTLLDETQKKHEYLYWEFHERKATNQAVRMGNWKAVRHSPAEPIELYDLAVDIGEENDVSADHSGIVQKMADIIGTARTESSYWKMKGGEAK